MYGRERRASIRARLNDRHTTISEINYHKIIRIDITEVFNVAHFINKNRLRFFKSLSSFFQSYAQFNDLASSVVVPEQVNDPSQVVYFK